jgi:ubiquinone/menaquinone biosynthesis C-methylase UbiE
MRRSKRAEAVDYNQAGMGRLYDRARNYRPEVMASWLRPIAACVPAARDILDLGCGTGRFTQALADLYAARVTGIDPSPAMLAQAAEKPTSSNVRFVCAAAEAIPAPEASFDLVFSSMAFHHFADRDAAARECCRVLRPGGFVLIRNATREKTRYSPYARFFRGFVAIVDAKLPAQADIADVFTRAGFALRAHVPIWHAMAARWEELADKASLRADSLLAAVEDPAFEEGLQAMRTYASHADPGERIGLEIDLYVFQLRP